MTNLICPKIYDIEMGSQAPSIKSVDVNNVTLDEEGKLIESVDVGFHLDYSGGFAIGIDVSLAYGKTAFLSAKGIKVFHFNLKNKRKSSCRKRINYFLFLLTLTNSRPTGRNPSLEICTTALFTLGHRLLSTTDVRTCHNF